VTNDLVNRQYTDTTYNYKMQVRSKPTHTLQHRHTGGQWHAVPFLSVWHSIM